MNRLCIALILLMFLGKMAYAVDILPGDCDASGVVSISEVQSAINMFLGLKTVSYCVDSDNSRVVSISEVQKAINSFLGLGTPLSFYNISGLVSSGGAGLPGVAITLSGAGSSSVITNVGGSFTFTGFLNGGYTVTPAMTGYLFTPSSSQRNVSGQDIAGVNFDAVQMVQVVPCPSSGVLDVAIQGFAFNPQNLFVSTNGIVRWTNSDGQDHTVSSGVPPDGDNVFDSKVLKGASVCMKFQVAGTYPYYCRTHPGMTGVITVQ